MHYGEFGSKLRELVELETAWQLRGHEMTEQAQLANRSQVVALVSQFDRLNLCDMTTGCDHPGCIFNLSTSGAEALEGRGNGK